MNTKFVLAGLVALSMLAGRSPAAAPDLKTMAGIAGDFSAGLKALELNAGGKAAELLGRVFQNTNAPADIRNLAGLFRIEALARAEQKADAQAAAKSFYLTCPADDLRAAAFQSFKTLGGKESDVLPKESPSAMLLRLAAAVGDEDNPNPQALAEFRSHIGGGMFSFMNLFSGMMMGGMGDDMPDNMGDRMLAEMLSGMMKESHVAEETISPETGRAKTSFATDGPLVIWESVVSTNGWIFTDMKFQMPGGGIMGHRAAMAVGGAAVSVTAPVEVADATAKPADAASDLDEKTRKDIDQLINQLGDRDSAIRSNARAKLKELGAKARPQLEQARRNPDPEISQTAKQLLSE